METDLNWGALEEEVQKRKSSNKAYDKLRPFFSNDSMQASTDPDLDKQAVLSQVYGLTFDKDPMEIYDSFQGAANAFHGEDGLSIGEQFNRISEGYNRVVPDTPKAEVQNIINVPGAPVKVKLKDAKSPEEKEKALAELFKSSKPLNQMMTFGAIKPTISETLKGLAYGMGTIVAGKAGEARMQGDMPYLTGSLIPSGIKSEPQLPVTGNEMANSLDEAAKDIWNKYDTSSGMQVEWGRGNKYGMPSWWTVNIAKNLPFMAKEMVEAIPAGIGGGLAVKGAQTFLKNTPTYIKLISKLPAAIKGLVKGTPAALSATMSSAPDEALMEGEMAAMRVKDAGGSDDQAKLAFYGTAKKNLALLSIDNYLGYMSAFMPGKLGKTLGVAFNMGQQGIEEIVQDEISAREVVKALPKLYGEIMPSSTFRDFFDVIGNEEKRDAFLLALPMGLGEPVSMFTAKIMEEAATGQATPKQVFEAQRLFDSEMLKKKAELETKENPTPNDIKEKELFNKYITPDGTIINRHNFIQDHVEFVQQRNIAKAQEILDGDLAPEEMTRVEIIQNLNLDRNTTLSNDELKHEFLKQDISKDESKKTAFNDYVNYLRSEGNNGAVINVIDKLKQVNEDVVKGEYIHDPAKVAQGTLNLYQGADPKTVAHEISHDYSFKTLKYDAQTGDYEDKNINQELDQVAQLYKDRGIFVPSDRDEIFSKLAEDHLEGNLTESFLSKIPKALKSILEKIKALFTEMSNSAKLFKELVASGKISPELLGHLGNAIQGKLSIDQVSEIVNNNPKVQNEAKAVENIAQELGIDPVQIDPGTVTRYQKEDVQKSISDEDKTRLVNLIEEFKTEIDRDSLSKEQKGVYDVITGNQNIAKIQKDDLDVLKGFVILREGSRTKGAIHVLLNHYKTAKGALTAEEIINIGKVIRDSLPIISKDDKDRVSHKYITIESGIKYQVIVKPKDESVITYYSNRKNKTEAVEHNASSGLNPSTSVSNKIIDQSSKKSNSDSTITRNQTATVQEVLQDHIKAYNRIRKADNVFKQFNSTFYLDRNHELKSEILGRVEEMTGKKAPIGYDEKYDEYIAGASKHLNYIKSDKFATAKFVEKLKGGSIESLQQLADGLALMEKDIKSMEHVAKYQKTEKRNVDQDETGEKMLREQAVKNAQSELLTNIKLIQQRVWKELSIVPRMGRDVDFLKQLVKSHNKTSFTNPEQYLENTRAFVEAQIEKVEARENVERFDSKLNFAIKKRNTPGGQKKSISTPEYDALLREVKTIRNMSVLQAGDEIQKIIAVIEKENREATAEEGRRFIWLDTFNGLEKKTPKEIKDSLEQLDSLIEKGKLKREILEEEWKKKKEELNKKSRAVILGAKELGTAEERSKKIKADAKGWKAIKNGIETMFNSQATFEMLMNALSRNDVLSPSMKSFLNTYFAVKVHIATQNEETANRKRVDELTKELNKIWGLDKETNKIKRAITYQNKFSELEKTIAKTGLIRRVPIYKTEPVDIKFDEAIKLVSEYALGKKTGVFTEKFAEAENIEEIVNHLKDFVYEKVREQIKYESDLAQSNPNYAKHRKLTATADEFTFKTLAELIKKDEVKLSEFIQEYPMGSTRVYIMESRGKLEEIEMSQAEAIQYWLSAQQYDVLEKMFINGWNDDNILQLDKFLTPESKTIAKMLQSKYKEQYNPMNEVYKKLWWVDMPQITNYARAMYEVEKDNSETNKDDIPAGGALYNSPFATAVPKSTVERVQHRHDLKKVSAIEVYTRSIAESSHFIHWAELSKELRGVFKNADTRKTIKQEFGNTRLKMLDHQIDMLINGGIKQHAFDHLANIMRGYTSKIMQSGKAALIFTQLTGIVNYGAYVDPIKLTAELGKFWMDGRKNMKALMKINYIRNRYYGSGQSQEINMMIKQGQGKPKNYLKKGLDSGMYFTRKGDILTVMQGYWAVRNIKYAEYIEQGMSKVEAKTQAQLDAEMISDRTQSGGGLKDQGWLQSQGGTVNLFQTFMSAQRVLLNIVHESIADAIAGKKGAHAIKATVITWILNGILFQAAADLLKNLFDDDDKFTLDWRDYINASLIGPLNSIPIVAGLLTYTARKLSGQYTSGVTLIPGTEGVTNMIIDGITSGSYEKALKGLERGTGVGMTEKLITGGYENKK